MDAEIAQPGILRRSGSRGGFGRGIGGRLLAADGRPEAGDGQIAGREATMASRAHHILALLGRNYGLRRLGFFIPGLIWYRPSLPISFL